jgi:cytochrome c oxidase subunit 2
MLDLWLPRAASSFAEDIDGLIITITVIVGVWFIVAEAVLLYLLLRFRRKEGVKAAYLPARTLRGMSVVLLPCVVILGFDLLVDAEAAPIWEEIKEKRPPHDLEVRVTGEQWAWRFTYPGPDGEFDTADDFWSLNEMALPVNKVVLFHLNAKDVLHSFFIPEMRVKQDAVPGRTITGWFEPILEGSFPIVCAEICGFGHTVMQSKLLVENDQGYQAWLDSKGAGG